MAFLNNFHLETWEKMAIFWQFWEKNWQFSGNFLTFKWQFVRRVRWVGLVPTELVILTFVYLINNQRITSLSIVSPDIFCLFLLHYQIAILSCLIFLCKCLFILNLLFLFSQELSWKDMLFPFLLIIDQSIICIKSS